MPKKKAAKNMTGDELEKKYWHTLLTTNQRPASVYAFANDAGLDEGDFYEHAASFEALESSYWERLVTETIEVLHTDDDYKDYPSDQKLLAFFYTFIAHAQKHRSRLIEFFPRPGCSKTLKPMRKRFIEYAQGIIQQGLEEGNVADRKKLNERYPQLLFEQFRSIIEFYRRDQSEEFQDTDALIEKSVRLGADLARSGTLDSAFDLARFLLRKITL